MFVLWQAQVVKAILRDAYRELSTIQEQLSLAHFQLTDSGSSDDDRADGFSNLDRAIDGVRAVRAELLAGINSQEGG